MAFNTTVYCKFIVRLQTIPSVPNTAPLRLQPLANIELKN